MSGNGPEEKFKAGGIVATVWKNQPKINGKETVKYSVQFEKRYKDKEGNWQSTSSLDVNELPKASLVLSEAYKYLAMKQSQDTNGAGEEA